MSGIERVGLDVRLGTAEYLQGILGTGAFDPSWVVTPTRRPRLRKSL